MKKKLLTLIACIVVESYAMAQCTPDDNIKTTGIFPALLDTGLINTPYSQIIQYYITKDTNVVFGGSPINAIIDSITITGVKGMPAGLTYNCHNATCTSPGGKTGCVRLSGTPTQSGIFPITVYLTIRARAFLGPIPIGQTVSDSNSRYFIAIKPLTSGLLKTNINNQIHAYQNNETFHVFCNQLKVYSCQLKDISGKTVVLYNQFVENIDGELSANISSLSKGIYFVEVYTNEGIGIKKVFIQ